VQPSKKLQVARVGNLQSHEEFYVVYNMTARASDAFRTGKREKKSLRDLTYQ
jgi:hypothetical protein